MPKMYSYTLVKGDEVYVIKYSKGNEMNAIEQTRKWANNPELSFDWFDAIILTRQICLRLKDLSSRI
ncbi:hypothetical protein FJZ19_02690 [Candidatus Pacearchaeota archaeon]|nr:hypothetical protein [Candidatus Pacearchaeota archaeon]